MNGEIQLFTGQSNLFVAIRDVSKGGKAFTKVNVAKASDIAASRNLPVGSKEVRQLRRDAGHKALVEVTKEMVDGSSIAGSILKTWKATQEENGVTIQLSAFIPEVAEPDDISIAKSMNMSVEEVRAMREENRKRAATATVNIPVEATSTPAAVESAPETLPVGEAPAAPAVAEPVPPVVA